MPKDQLPQFSGILDLPSETLREMQTIWQNTLEECKSNPSLPNELPSIEELRNLSWPKDAVVVARGPSFFRQNCAEKLKQARARGLAFLLISVDRAAQTLLENGVIPDLIVSVDPQDQILRFFGSVFDQYAGKLNVATCVFVHTKVLQRLRDLHCKIFSFFPMADDERYMEDMWKRYPDSVALSCGGNVGTASYNLARFLDATSICLCGFDMSFPLTCQYGRRPVIMGMLLEIAFLITTATLNVGSCRLETLISTKFGLLTRYF